MLTIGVNAGKTAFGKKLKDGATAVAHDGEILFASAEERFSRVKHDGGFKESLSHFCSSYSLSSGEPDIVVLTTCCEHKPSESIIAELKQDLSAPVHVISHHLSHAASAFYPSPFEEAIILVADAGGNVLTPTQDNQWWLYPREQFTCYIGRGTKIELFDRSFDQPKEAGLGEVYRAFTHYLGWHSHTLSANTMALAAFASHAHAELDLFELKGSRLTSSLVNDPQYPIKMVKNAIKSLSDNYVPPRPPRNSSLRRNSKRDSPANLDELRFRPTGEYAALAAWVQKSLEKALVAKVSQLIEATGITNVCLAGGVALNCVANRKILDQTKAKAIFIQPAAGDDGQALGNALWAQAHFDDKRPQKWFNPYLGPTYHESSYISALDKFNQLSNVDLVYGKPPQLTKKVAKMLSNGKVIAWYQGRSEYGPRALGNRSILSDPRSEMAPELCHKIKEHHELFRPFAPSIKANAVSTYFDIPVPSPYMLLVGRVQERYVDQTRGVVHCDGTSRIQSVTKQQNTLFYNLLDALEKETGTPLLLNTSFNRRGEPIVETPEDALKCFNELDLDALVMGPYLIKSASRVNEDRQSEPMLEDVEYV